MIFIAIYSLDRESPLLTNHYCGMEYELGWSNRVHTLNKGDSRSSIPLLRPVKGSRNVAENRELLKQ